MTNNERWQIHNFGWKVNNYLWFIDKYDLLIYVKNRNQSQITTDSQGNTLSITYCLQAYLSL